MNSFQKKESGAPITLTEAAASHPVRASLVVGALGVVFGDIGTSPIYAFRESIKAAGNSGDPVIIFGVLSLVFWAVVLVVAVKYVLIVMRADNDGEGGTMALLSLVLPASGKMRSVLLIVGLGGVAFLRRCDDHSRYIGAERGRGRGNCCGHRARQIGRTWRAG